MDKQRVSTNDPSANFGRPGQCILKVLHGKHQGTLKPLTNPVTLLGEDKGCDIRLNSPLVEQLQCVIVETPQGFLVRNLYDCDKVKINGEIVEQGLLHTGDELAVGPFSFLVQYAEAGLSAQSKLTLDDHLEDEKQALRAQAAGVAAQQSALLQEELAILDKGKIINEKEKQLGLHFQEKHLRQVQIQRTLKTRFIKLKQQETSITVQLKQQQDELLLQTDAANAKQLRYAKLRSKLKSRWKIIARRQLNILADKNLGIERANAAFEKEYSRIQKERKSLAEAQQLFDSECDQEKIKHKASFDLLEAEVQERANQTADHEAELLQREKTLAFRESALSENQKVLLLDQKHWQSYLAQLKFEEQGLERRILNLRDKLPPSSWPIIPQEPIAQQTIPTYNIPKDAHTLITELEGMASHLDDQRLRLLEAWHNIEQKKLTWENEQISLLAQLEIAAKELSSKQHLLQNRDRNCAIWEDQNTEQSLALSQLRKLLEADKAQFNLEFQTFSTEKFLLLQELEFQKQASDQFSKINQDSRKELLHIRLQGRIEFNKERNRLEEMQQASHGAWRDYQSKLLNLEQQKQSLAIQELAISRLALEVGNNNLPGGERRLEKMRKNIELRFTEELKQITEARSWIQNEFNSLNLLIQSSSFKDNDLDLRVGDFERAQFDFENIKAEELQEKIKLLNSLKLLELKNLQFEKRIEQLTLELEKLLAVVFDESSAAKVKVPGAIRLAA